MSQATGVPFDPAMVAPLRVPGEPLPAGTDLGRFQVVRLAGVGGMGEVYQAWDNLLERYVALKSVLPEELENPAHLARFRWEARALAQLSHPHVCQVYDLVTLGAETFIAMEWLEGETLDVAAIRMDRRARLKVLRAVAEGLAYAHSKAMVHRDLKPANLMVLPDGNVKILDFGLARLGLDLDELPVAAQDGLPGASAGSLVTVVRGGDLATAGPAQAPRTASQGSSGSKGRSEVVTRQGMFMGSPRYASPEQVRGELAGTPSDVWSLGMLAWELLLEENPFAGEGAARLHAVLEGRRRSARGRGLSRRLVGLLESLLSMDLSQRPSAEAVARKLAKELAPRRTAWWVVSQAAILLVAVAGTYLLFGRSVAADFTRATPARLAIYPAVDHTGFPKSANLARYLVPDLLAAGLRNVERLRVVEAEDVGKATRQLRLDLSQGFTDPVMVRVAASVGAKLFLAPTLERDNQGRVTLLVELRDGAGRVRYRTKATTVADERTLSAACLQLAEMVARDVARAMDPLGSQRIPDSPLLDQAALDRYAVARSLVDASDFQGAEPHFRAVALQYPAFSPGVKGYARCLAKTGTEPAEPVFLWARSAAKAQGYLVEEIHTLHFQIAFLLQKGERERALSLCREGLTMAQGQGLAIYRGMFHNQIATVAMVQNRKADAEAALATALACMVEAQDPQGIARFTNNLAVLEKSQGKLEQAQVHYRQFLSTMEAVGDQWGVAVGLSNLGDLHLILGKLDQAEGYLKRALQLRTDLGDEPGITATLINLAGLAQARGNLGLAIEHEQRALALARRLQMRPTEGLCLYNLGEFHRDAGRFPEAIQAYRASNLVHQALADHDMQAHALAGEAECVARTTPARLAGARQLFKEAQALSPGENPYFLRTQAWLARTAGQPALAKVLFQKALDQAWQGAPELTRELKASL